MRAFLFFIILVSVIFSCNSGSDNIKSGNSLSKIDINNFDEHNKYLTEFIASCKTDSCVFYKTNTLINQYKELLGDNNSNVDYYIGRLYTILLRIKESFYFDTVQMKPYDNSIVLKIIDSAFFYNYRATIANKHAIRPARNLCETMFTNRLLASKYKIDGLSKRDSIRYYNAIDYVVNSAESYITYDTSVEKKYSRAVCELAIYYLDGDLEVTDVGDINSMSSGVKEKILLIGKLNSYLIKFKGSELVKYMEANYIDNRYASVYSKLLKEQKRIEEEKILKEELERNTVNLIHETENDWDTDATIRKLGQKVWEECNKNSNLQQISINVVDVCKDRYGKQSKYTSKIKITRAEIKIYQKYLDASSFKANCSEWLSKILESWRPCGKNLLYNYN